MADIKKRVKKVKKKKKSEKSKDYYRSSLN